jgi:hypothetical protein
VDGTTAAIGGSDGLHLFSIASAEVTRSRLTTVAAGRPNPTVAAAVPAGAPPTASLQMTLPAELAISSHATILRQGITATGGACVTHDGQAITLALSEPQSHTAVHISPGALGTTATLRRTLSRIEAHGGRDTLTIPVTITDTNDQTTQSTITFVITRSPGKSG